MKKETQLELKVGLFLSAGIGLILFAILMLGGATSVFARKNSYVMHFPAGEGLISGSKVLLGGLSVGVVSDVNFEPASRNVRVEISVERRFADMIRADSTGEIATQGLLGDRYVAVTLGGEGADPLPDGAEIPVRPSKDLAQILSQSDKLMVNLNRIATNLDQILASFNTGNRSEAFFAGMASTAKNMSQVSAKLSSQLDEMKLGDSGRRLNSILTKIDRGEGTVGALINDPAMYDDLKSLTGGANRNRVLRNIVRKSIKDAEAAESPAAK